MVGNACADVLAGRGAIMGEVPSAVADQVLSFMSLVVAIQRRMLVVLGPILEKRPVIARAVVTLNMPAGTMALASDHSLVAPNYPYCLKCGWGGSWP